MGILGMILVAGGVLITFACWIMTLIAMFKDEQKGGVVHGIIGIVCNLWAYIWGWMHGNKKVQVWWTVGIVVFVIGYALVGAEIFANLPEQQ